MSIYEFDTYSWIVADLKRSLRMRKRKRTRRTRKPRSRR